MSSRDLGKPDEICSCFLVKRNAEVPTPPRSPALARVTKFGLSSLLIGYFRRSPLVAVPTPLGRQSSDPPISTKTPKPCYLRLITRPDSRPGSRPHGHDTLERSIVDLVYFHSSTFQLVARVSRPNRGSTAMAVIRDQKKNAARPVRILTRR